MLYIEIGVVTVVIAEQLGEVSDGHSGRFAIVIRRLGRGSCRGLALFLLFLKVLKSVIYFVDFGFFLLPLSILVYFLFMSFFLFYQFVILLVIVAFVCYCKGRTAPTWNRG